MVKFETQETKFQISENNRKMAQRFGGTESRGTAAEYRGRSSGEAPEETGELEHHYMRPTALPDDDERYIPSDAN